MAVWTAEARNRPAQFSSASPRSKRPNLLAIHSRAMEWPPVRMFIEQVPDDPRHREAEATKDGNGQAAASPTCSQ